MTDPDPVVEEIGALRIVRDDLVRGGTKARVIPQLLEGIGAAEEVVYCSPASGYAQLALAIAAPRVGRRVTIFTAARREPHARTLETAALGARIVSVPVGYMTVVRARAREHCRETGATLLPFGLDHPIVLHELAAVARRVEAPLEVWSVAGSGTLTRALQRAWPRARFFAVRIGTQPDEGRATLLRSPLPFERDARERPPFPSCSNYDAKAWEFVTRRASSGALFWNVAA